MERHQVTKDSTTFTFYMTGSGFETYVVPEAQVALFLILDKLGIKSARKNTSYTLVTTNNCVITTSDSITINASNGFVASQCTCVGFEVEPYPTIQVPQPTKKKKRGLPRDIKQERRKQQWQPQRNTGRK